ncbi:AAA family ATPase [Halomonas sp. Y3]|uniref:AAA family ATPase n=1 Tax=Halomonas sp. Y3 TaxID=2956797 RepID=UPI00209CF3AC|nr:AAA family ATPase [Halomonas sp. Y3]
MPFINDRLEGQNAGSAPASRLTPGVSRFTFDPARVMAQLRQGILGQPQALAALEDLLHVVKAELSPEQRPLGVVLLMGPTGVGKTETVRLLARAIQGRDDGLCRIDMNTLGQEHYASALVGAPPGYVGSKEGHSLFDAERIRGSFSTPGVVLFDELEKASPEVIRTLLNVLDSGWLTLPAGNRQVDFCNALIFMTSNLGAAELARYQGRFQRGWRRLFAPDPARQKQLLEEALHRRFEPEFINRIDRILHYQPVAGAPLEALLDLELAKLNERLSRQGRTLSLGPTARRWLQEQHDSRFGARDLARRLRTQLLPLLAREMMHHPEIMHWHADLHKGEWVMRGAPYVN